MNGIGFTSRSTIVAQPAADASSTTFRGPRNCSPICMRHQFSVNMSRHFIFQHVRERSARANFNIVTTDVVGRKMRPRAASRRRRASSGTMGDVAAVSRLSPRPTPRHAAGSDVVLVVAQEALAIEAVTWQQRFEQERAANARLHDQLESVETELRRSVCSSCRVWGRRGVESVVRSARTDVKRRRELPNNEAFTKQLVEENRRLVKETRRLRERLMRVRRCCL